MNRREMLWAMLVLRGGMVLEDDGGRIAKGMAADVCVFAGAADPRGAPARLPVLVILAGKVVRGEPPAEPR